MAPQPRRGRAFGLVALAAGLCCPHGGRAQTRVACVGASIVAGYHSSPGRNYPERLQQLLGPGYHVENFGVSGTTMLKHGNFPYWGTEQFRRLLSFQPHIAVILLGSNDSKDRNWLHHSGEYSADYAAMIAQLRALASRPEVYAAVPPPLYKEGMYDMRQEVVNVLLPQLIRNIVHDNNLPPAIDVFSAFASHCPNFTLNQCDWISDCTGKEWCHPEEGIHDDGCHPNDEGYLQIAKVVQQAILQETFATGPREVAAQSLMPAFAKKFAAPAQLSPRLGRASAALAAEGQLAAAAVAGLLLGAAVLAAVRGLSRQARYAQLAQEAPVGPASC